MAEGTVDLLRDIPDHWYHRDQRYSLSIEAVLSASAAGLDYGSIEVEHRGDAQAPTALVGSSRS